MSWLFSFINQNLITYSVSKTFFSDIISSTYFLNTSPLATWLNSIVTGKNPDMIHNILLHFVKSLYYGNNTINILIILNYFNSISLF